MTTNGKPQREPNPCAVERKKENAYEYWATPDGSWVWCVLKKWKSPTNEAKDKYARWMCAVQSPLNYPSWDYGDVYAAEIQLEAIKLDYNPFTRPKADENVG